MTLKIGANILPNINPGSDKNSSVNISNQTSTNSEKTNNAALLHLTNRLTNDDVKTPTVGDFLDKVLEKQPLETGKKEKRVNLDVKYPKPPEDMTVEDYKQALIRAEYKQAGLGMLTDEEINMSEAALGAKGFSVKYYDFNVESLRRDHQTGKPLFTTDHMIERAQRGGQAVLQYQQSKAERADESKAKAENEVNQMFLDQARVLWNSGVNIVEGTINTGLDAAASNGGRNPLIFLDPTRPQVDFSGAKMDYQSEMMRRDINGKVDGDGIKRGDFTEAGVTILAPLVVGMATKPSVPQSLKTLGGIPEVETAATTANAINQTSETAIQIKKQSEIIETSVKPVWKPTPSETVPTFKRPVGSIGTPEKPPTKITNARIAEQARSLKRQNEAAEVMSGNGYVVEYQPKIDAQQRMSRFPWLDPKKNPDFKIEGEIFDAISPNKNTNIKNIIGRIEEKTLTNQARRILLNLDDNKASISEIAKEIRLSKLEFLDEVIVVRDNKITKIYPYNSAK